MVEARELCERAEDLCPDAAIAGAFQTALARPTRDWTRRAEAVAKTVSPRGDTVCGARAKELRRLIDTVNVALMRPNESRERWREFYHSTREIQVTGAPSGS
jgi:hypothetical protein